MTLKEYLMDYSSEETRRIGEALIEKEIGSIPKEKVQQIVEITWQRLNRVSGISGFSRGSVRQLTGGEPVINRK